MTSRRQSAACAGFTLIEIIVVILLIITIIGIGILSLTAEGTRKQIEEPAADLKVLARRALTSAINERHAFAIHFTVDSFSLREGSGAVAVEEAEADPRFAALYDEQRTNAGGVVEAHKLENLTVEVRRWGEKHFRAPMEEGGDYWVFEPSGICEPIGVRLLHREGSIEMHFNPLSAKPDQQFLIVGEEPQAY